MTELQLGEGIPVYVFEGANAFEHAKEYSRTHGGGEPKLVDLEMLKKKSKNMKYTEEQRKKFAKLHMVFTKSMDIWEERVRTGVSTRESEKCKELCEDVLKLIDEMTINDDMDPSDAVTKILLDVQEFHLETEQEKKRDETVNTFVDHAFSDILSL